MRNLRLQDSVYLPLLFSLVFFVLGAFGAYNTWQHRNDVLVRTENNDWRRRTPQETNVQTLLGLGLSATFAAFGILSAAAILRGSNFYFPSFRLSQTFHDFPLSSSVQIGPFYHLDGKKLALRLRYEAPWQRDMVSFRLYPPTRISPPMEYEIVCRGLKSNELHTLSKRNIEHTESNAEGHSDIKWKRDDTVIYEDCEAYFIEVTPLTDAKNLIWPQSLNSNQAAPCFLFSVSVDIALTWNEARRYHSNVKHFIQHAKFHIKSHAERAL